MQRAVEFENGMIGKVTIGGRGTVELGFFDGKKIERRRVSLLPYE